MIGLWFTFRRDGLPLIESVEVFRETFPDAKICLCDEGAQPLTREIIERVQPDHYERSDVFRSGNLNGCECAAMMLDFQVRMGLKFGGKGAIKIDCDTLIYSGDWIDQDAPVCGCVLAPVVYPWGACRWLSHEAAGAALEYLISRRIVPGKAPEDQVIGTMLLHIYGSSCKLSDWDPLLLTGWHYNRPNRPTIYDAAMVGFGNRNEMLGKTKTRQLYRELTAETMQNYRKERSRKHA